MAASNNKPTHAVYVVQGEGDKAFWTRIGSAWPFKDGKPGFNIQLVAAPLDGRLVLSEIREKPQSGE